MIINDTDDIQVKGSSKADEIENVGVNVSIDAGAGNDTITNDGGNYALIHGKDGNDSIYVTNSNYVTVDGGSGNDTVTGTFESSEIKGASGNDIVEAEIMNDGTIDGGDGADEISGVFVGSSINGGTGNDLITLQMNDNGESAENTISGGKGNDTIINEVANEYEDSAEVPGNVYKYASGDGNDVFQGFGSNDTLQITSGSISDSLTDENGNVIFTIGTGSITIEGMAEKSFWLQLGNKDPEEVYPGEPPTPSDYIELTTGKDDYENTRDNVTIAALAGNDTLYNIGAAVSINGGAGADVITNDGNDVTVTGGAGNDSITNNGNGFVYEYEGGKDVFTQYNGENILIDGDYTTSISGNDWVIKINNSTSKTITLKDAAEQNIFVNGEEIPAPPPMPAGWKFTSGKATATLTTAVDLDLNESYGEGITKVDATKVTSAISIIGSNDGVSLRGGKGADTIQGGDGNDTLTGLAGADVFVYTGGDDTITDYGTGTDTIKLALDDMEDISAESIGNNVVINNSVGKITIQKAVGKEINLIDIHNEEYKIPVKTDSIVGTAKVETLTNSDDEMKIYGLGGNDKIENSGNNVSITGGAGNDTIYNEGEGVVYYYSSGEGKDVIHGFGENDTLQIVKGSYSTSISGDDWVVKIGSGTVTLKDAAGQAIIVNDETIKPEVLPSGWKKDSAKGLLQASVATAESEIDLAENSYGEGITKVDASKIKTGVTITGNAEGISIKGGAGADYIIGGTGDDTVSLGAGNDVYVYTGGDDLIQDYKAGQDTIQFVGIGAGDFTTSVKANDLIFLTPNGNVTVKNGNKAAEVLVIDENEVQIWPSIDAVPEGWKKDSAKSLLQASVATAETEINLNEDYGEDVVKVDSTKITSGAFITGNDFDNSIKAGTGDDTLAGGDGNDTLTGGKGADVFVYSGGDDVITDFGTGADSIQIDTANYQENSLTFETIGTNFVITTSNGGTLTVKNGKTKDVIVMDEDGNQIYPGEPPVPEGWTLDSAKKKITATTSNAEDLNLTEGGSVAENIEKIDAAKTSAISILGNSLDNSIKGGAGNDTLDGGDGNDTLTGGSGADVFIYSGGTDVITDYVAGTDSIQIDTVNVEMIGVATIGTNVIVSTELGDLTVKKANNKVVLIMDADGNQIYPGVEPLPKGWQYDSTHKQIKALADYPEELDLNKEYGEGVGTVDAAKAKDGVVIIGGEENLSIKGSKFSDTITGSNGDDKVSLGAGKDVYIYTGGDDIIQDYVANADSIQFDTGDIEAISKTDSGVNVLIATSAGNITVTKGKGKNIVVMDQDGNEIPFDDTLPAGWKLDSSKTNASATVSSPSELDLTKDYGENILKVDASKAITAHVIGNEKDNSIKGGKNDDVIEGGFGNDTISLGGGADVYVYSGGDDLIQDYVAGTDTIQADTKNIKFEATETVGSNIVYTTNNGTLTVKNGKGKTITLVDMQGNDIIINPVPTLEGWKLDSKGTMYTATVKTADNLDLTEDGFESVEKVNGSKITSGVEIKGNALNNSLKGGSGADTIFGGEGNDTVSLGGGADVYVYTAGDDLIQDYKAGQDAIQFEAKVLSAKVSSSNVIITTDEGNVTVKNGKDKDISVILANGEETTINNVYPINPNPMPEGLRYNTAKTILTATTVFSGDVIDLGELPDSDAVTKINATALKSGVEIIGNDLGNSIKGGSGADTLLGGEGNDTLTGGNGDDLFVYNGGNDVITDYKAGQDAIQINTRNIDIEGKATVGTNVVISTELGNITVKSGKGKEITVYDQNGDELWFDEDGTFIKYNVSDSLSEITNSEFALGEIDLANDVDVVNPDDEFIATYSEQNK